MAPHQDDRPFDQAGDLVEQACRPERRPGRRRRELPPTSAAIMVAALVRVEHDMGWRELRRGKSSKLLDRDVALADRKRWPACLSRMSRPAMPPGRRAGQHLAVEQRRRYDCSGRTQRRCRWPSASIFGQGKFADRGVRSCSGSTSAVGAAGLVDHGELELALAGVALLALLERRRGRRRAGSRRPPARARRRAGPCAPRCTSAGAAGRPSTTSASRRGVA